MDFLSYTPEQMNEIVEFISQKYEGDGYIAHETNSEYVHTDVNISADGEMIKFVTFGMGAAKMNSPFEEFTRIELVMSSSLDTDIMSRIGRDLLSGLIDLSKYPFRNIPKNEDVDKLNEL